MNTKAPAHDPIRRVGDAWLCMAYGETDRPCVTLAEDREAVKAFIVDQWIGDANDPDLPDIMATFDAHDWSDGALEWEFEIGGVEIRDVFDVTPRAQLQRATA